MNPIQPSAPWRSYRHVPGPRLRPRCRTSRWMARGVGFGGSGRMAAGAGREAVSVLQVAWVATGSVCLTAAYQAYGVAVRGRPACRRLLPEAAVTFPSGGGETH